MNVVRKMLNNGIFLEEDCTVFFTKEETLSHKGDKLCQNQSRLMPEVQV